MKRQMAFAGMNNSGFSLIELMVVIVILGLLVGIVAPRFLGRTDDAKIAKVKVDITALETALKLYKLDNGRYPTTEQGLLSLIEPPQIEPLPQRWRTGGYIESRSAPKDPWGNEFVYLCPGSNGEFDISSFGADGVSGGEDIDQDINSWEIE